MGPLARRSLWRLARSGVWGWLVAGAFLLSAAAAAAAPLFSEASGNAALIARLDAVPEDAVAADAPVVRVVGGQGPTGRGRVDGGLENIPGLSPGFGTASSMGVESRPKLMIFTPFVATGSAEAAEAAGVARQVGAPGTSSERARIFGDDDLTGALVPAPGSRLPARTDPAIESTSGAESGGLPQVWLPAPLADRLQVGPGDAVAVGVQTSTTVQAADAQVAGIYAVGPDGRSPADPPGSSRWTYRHGELPGDSEFRTLTAFLLVTDVVTAGRLAEAIGDDVFYAVEGHLQPAQPTLTQAAATVAGIRQRQIDVRDPALNGESAGQFREQVVSGLPTIVADADRVAARTVAWTRTVGSAALLLGLLAVLAVAVFGLVRRSVEVRHTTGLGVPPSAVGALAVVEVLPVAAICAGAGLALGWALVAAVGPPGAITATGLSAAAWQAGLVVAVGALLIGVAATLAAIRSERLTAQDRPARPLPWEPSLLAVAVTAAAGLFVRPSDGGPPSPLDLLVPVLVLAATGAVGARLVLRLVALTLGRSSYLAFSRRPVTVLAVRRIAAGGRQAVLLITVLTLGFGFLIYSLAAAASLRQVTGDRAAVLAGARATVAVEASWLLDPQAPELPKRKPEEAAEISVEPVPGTRTPPLPAGTTIVWRGRITVPPEYGNVDLLVIDPLRFAEVASWGTGPELRQAKGLLGALETADVQATAQLMAGQHTGPIPAVGVGQVQQRKGDSAAIATDLGDVPIKVMDVVPAFPGGGGALPLMVVPADSFFAFLGESDPRVRPASGSGRFTRGPTEYYPSLWSSTDLGALQRVLNTHDVEAGAVTRYEQFVQEPDLVAARASIGYQVALGFCVAGLAVLGLAMFADRSVTRARAADLLLTRMGLGRRGTARARAVELAAFALIALLLAGAGVGLIIPFGARLLDPGGGSVPAFVLRLDSRGWAVSTLVVLFAVGVALLVSRSRSSAASAGSSAEVLRSVD